MVSGDTRRAVTGGTCIALDAKELIVRLLSLVPRPNEQNTVYMHRNSL